MLFGMYNTGVNTKSCSFVEVVLSASSIWSCGNEALYILPPSFAQGKEFHVVWTPQDLTNHDMACLYSAQADGWTMIDEFGKYSSIHPPILVVF